MESSLILQSIDKRNSFMSFSASAFPRNARLKQEYSCHLWQFDVLIIGLKLNVSLSLLSRILWYSPRLQDTDTNSSDSLLQILLSVNLVPRSQCFVPCKIMSPFSLCLFFISNLPCLWGYQFSISTVECHIIIFFFFASEHLINIFFGGMNTGFFF